MKRGRWSVLASFAVIILFAACELDSGGPPVPGGPPRDPDAVFRRGGNGRYGLDHGLLRLGISPAGPAEDRSAMLGGSEPAAGTHGAQQLPPAPAARPPGPHDRESRAGTG